MEDSIKPRRNYKKFILAAAIIIILNLFLNYGVQTFYRSPDYIDFCGYEHMRPAPMPLLDKDKIDSAQNDEYIKAQEEYEKKQKECSDKFNEVRNVYNRNVFIYLIIAGFISIIIGFAVKASEAVSLGLSFGGLLSLIVGTIRYWSDMKDYTRFVILGIALMALIWIGFKKFRE